jgi:tol-pal system beta propeller repeat protein TolB
MWPDGSHPAQLTDTDDAEMQPVWSPDGRRIAFTRYTDDGNYDVFVMNRDGTGQTRLTSDPAWDGEPSWSPDGSHLAFESDRTGYFDVYTMRADGTDVTNITNNPGAGDSDPAWSPDGTKIAFASTRSGYSDIYVMPAGGGTATVLVADDSGYDLGPEWSPDGSKVAFSSNGHNPQYTPEAFEVDVATKQVTAVSHGNGEEPKYSPDGQAVIFHGARDDSPSGGPAELYVAEAGALTDTRLTDDPAVDAMPDWDWAPIGIRGDITLDEFVEALDALATLKEIEGIEEYAGYQLADMDCDGDTDATDVVLTLESLGGLYLPPAECYVHG